jgi:hypothetical protein
MRRRFSSIVFVVVGLGSYACSSSDTGGGNTTNTCKEYSPPAGTDLNNPQVSFKTDVYPIFTGSCGLSTSCHGSKTTSQSNLYLGSRTETDTSAVRNGIVGKQAQALAMNVVTAGDPKNSYLMHKMDGDQCTLTCKGGSCQRAMPDGSDPLSEEKRLVVRRWIAQGAKDN